MILIFLKKFWKEFTKTDMERYLEGSQDVYELERRIERMNYCKRYY